MTLFWCCIAAALLTIIHAAVDVEKTVQHVQSILQANELLPRLTREEIIQLLNDIRAEDAKSTSKPKQILKEIKITTLQPFSNDIKSNKKYENDKENEIAMESLQTKININENNDRKYVSASTHKSSIESTTKASSPTLTVVLPYTPRDGSSLQELYTKPPRLQVVAEQVTPKPSKTSKSKVQISKKQNQVNNPKLDLPAELQAFLDAHGLKGKPGQDNFLLPLEGFKPLPPAKIIDGTVQLPENLLLTYDLISPSDLSTSTNKKDQTFAQTNFLYEPLKPQIPFEILDTASSESKHTVLPLDLPKPRKPKATPSTPKPNYEPIDYEAIKVIPLDYGPNPIEDDVVVGTDNNKRQTNETDINDDTTTTTTTGSNNQTDTKNADIPESIPLDSDTGASIADLEESFGGAAPSEPGDSELPPPRKNGFYWMVDWNSFLEVGDGDTKVNIRFEPKLGDPQMFLPVNIP